MINLVSLVRYGWALPATVLGLLLGVAARAGGATLRVVDGVLEVGGGRVGRAIGRLPHAMQFSAITLGHVIIGLNERVLAECRAHEHVHVRQYERWGVFFFPLYLGSSAWQMLRGRDPYWHNHFEVQAYREELRLCGRAGREGRIETARARAQRLPSVRRSLR